MTHISQHPVQRIGGGNFRSFDCVSSVSHNRHRAVMRTLVCIAALFASLSVHAQEPQDTAKVYICTGSAAYAYHTHRDCRGLNKCTATIRTTTAKSAKKEGRKFCGYCKRRPAKTMQLRSDKVVTKKEDVL